MKGRIFDPKVGRFLTTDPIVAAPLLGQSWNPYTYVRNNPLAYVDPSGFEDEPGGGGNAGVPGVEPGPDGVIEVVIRGTRPDRGPEGKRTEQEGASEGALVGAGARPVDVSTTGSSSGYVPQPVTVAPTDWETSPYAQIEGGFLGGLMLGFVPFGGLGHQVLDAADVLPHGEPEARLGMPVGQIFGGIVTLLGGVTGEVVGGMATTTGIGAALGVPAIAVSTGSSSAGRATSPRGSGGSCRR
jgi:hypothetical protein